MIGLSLLYLKVANLFGIQDEDNGLRSGRPVRFDDGVLFDQQMHVRFQQDTGEAVSALRNDQSPAA